MSIKPNTQYKWEPEDKLTITGKEFDILYNSLMGFMNSPLSPTSFLAVADAAAISRIVLERAIEEGIAKEEAFTSPELVEEGVEVSEEIGIPVAAEEKTATIIDLKPDSNG